MCKKGLRLVGFHDFLCIRCVVFVSSPHYSQRAVTVFTITSLDFFVFGYLTVGFPTRIYRSTRIYLQSQFPPTKTYWEFHAFGCGLASLLHCDLKKPIRFRLSSRLTSLRPCIVCYSSSYALPLVVNLCFGMILRRILILCSHYLMGLTAKAESHLALWVYVVAVLMIVPNEA
jgi:hypothetical protein